MPAKEKVEINIAKMKVMRFNAVSEEKIMVNGEELEDVDSFVYLGAKVSAAGGADHDITSRLGKARAVFGKLTGVWKSNILNKSTKSRIFKSNVIALLLYRCESWRMTEGDEAKLDTFQQKCLRRLLKIYWPMDVSSEEVRRRANTETISELVRKRGWTWIGHVLHMDNSCLPRVALTWAPEGKCKRGRPKEMWRRSVEKEQMAIGFNSWVEAGLAAVNRVSWRSTICGPILHTGKRR